MTGSPSIVVIGDVALDRTLEIDRASVADEKRTVRSSRVELGGTGANIAVQAARLGADVELVSAVGDDERGREIRERLHAAGVGSRLVRVVPGPSTLATIVLDEPRRVYVEPGVAAAIDADAADLQHAELIIVSYAPQVVRELVEAGFGDRLLIGAEHWMLEDAGFMRALADVAWIVTNGAGWRALQVAALDGSSATVVVTDGPRAVRVFSGGVETVAVEPPRVEAVDATGAGDAFAGTLAHGIAAGMPLARALRRASVAGAAAATGRGAQSPQLDAEALARY